MFHKQAKESWPLKLKRKDCESGVDMSSGSQESGCSPGWGWGGSGGLVSPWWRKGCVCNWSAVAGDLLWRGGMREGLTALGCPPWTHKHIHSLSHTLQIETSLLCPPTPLWSLEFFSFFFLWKWVAILRTVIFIKTETLQQHFLAEQDLDLIRVWILWTWCCRHVARAWAPVRPGDCGSEWELYMKVERDMLFLEVRDEQNSKRLNWLMINSGALLWKFIATKLSCWRYPYLKQ